MKREYHVSVSTSALWVVRCQNRSDRFPCRWGLRAILKQSLGYFMITKYRGPHNCISSNVGVDHHNLDRNMIASTLLGIVCCDPAHEIKYMIESVKDRYVYEISYHKAWQSLKRAVERVYGTWESSVRLLPRFMGALLQSNYGTIVEWNHVRSSSHPFMVLHYVLWAFRPCINGFQHCRKIISVDGTHLYTKYRHKMLIVVTLEANNQILPLAFSIVDEETYDSWKWFLGLLATHVVLGERGVCLISDRHKGIVCAVDDVRAFHPPRGAYRYCLRHLCSNFNSKFKNVHLKDLCWEAGSQHQVRKFDATM